MNSIKDVYDKYHKSVNMTYAELKAWSKNPCSYKASLNRDPINRNLRLLSKNKSEWTIKDAREANKTISFIARMKKVKDGKKISKDCPYSKRVASLRNWGYDPYKK